MKNLITNGIDHGKFDLEWAKRGGICAIDDEGIGKTTLYIFTQRGFIALNRRGRDFFWEMPTHGDLYKQAIDSDMRMATCAECEAAGVEYIDRPNTSAKNTDPYTPANAVPPKTDTERLEHCFKYFIGRIGQKANINPAGTWYDSPREAIDAAMAAGKGGE